MSGKILFRWKFHEKLFSVLPGFIKKYYDEKHCVVFAWRAWNSMICWWKLWCKRSQFAVEKSAFFLLKNKKNGGGFFYCCWLMRCFVIFNDLDVAFPLFCCWNFCDNFPLIQLSWKCCNYFLDLSRKASFLNKKKSSSIEQAKQNFMFSNGIKIKLLLPKNLWSKKQCLPTIFNIFPF